MSEIQFTQRTIAPAGRNKYGNYLSKGNVTKSVVTTTYAGNDTTTTIGNTGATEDSGLTDFYCMLSQTNATFNATDLPQGATAATQVIAYKAYNKGVTFICDLDAVSATTGNEAITNLETPPFMGIKGMPESGLGVTFQNNGTSATTIIFTADNDLTGSTGVLYIPVCVYKRNDNLPNPDDLYSWYEHQYRVTSASTLEYIGDCEIVWLEYAWNVNRAAASLYNMDLSNQTAAVNVLSADTPSGDILAPNSIAALECTASTYLNGELLSGVTYSIFTQPRYNARGVNITNTANTGVLSFTSAGTNSFNFTGPTLNIDITATYSGRTIATKTMTITKNYPGGDGTPAHTRYIVTDYDVVKYNPNTSAFTPTQVVGTVMLQVGDQLPVFDPNPTIYLWYDGNETGKTSRFGQITANTYDGMSSITFALKNGDGDYYEVEEVPVISEGINGEPGQPGQPGASGASGESAWYLTLSNDNASINCDSNGSIYPGAVRPTCKCKLYHGSTKMTSGVLYEVDYGGATGVTYTPSLGELTLNFGSNFNFNGTTVAITVSASTKDDGSSVYTLRDVKVMTVTKSYDGENGEAGVSYFLQPSFGEVIYNPNTSTPNPNSITCAAYKQVGEDAVVSATNATIKYCWQSRSTGTFGSETAYTGAISINSSRCVNSSRLRFTLYVGSSQVDQEDVDIMMDGLDGDSGEGRPGPAIRGPYDYAEHSATTKCWCAGVSSITCSDCDKWIDVIYKDGTYYYCNTTYYGKLYPWSTVSSAWTSGDTFDFIATNLLLANNAKIKFLSNNALYLMDANGNITGGAKGGTGTTFWAGAENPDDPSDPAPFRVDVDGNIYAQKGVFAGYIQFPYTFVSDLDRGSARYKVWGSTTNTTGYIADNRAYLVSDTENISTGTGNPADFVLPAPSSAWNGFTYQIIVEPSLSRMDGNQQLHVFVSGATSSSVPASCTIYCYAFAELRQSENFYLRGGKYTITCMPKHNNGSKIYRWAITEATGALDTYSTTGSSAETLSTLVATSLDGPDPLYKLTTYTGSTKPSVYNQNQTMFIQK